MKIDEPIFKDKGERIDWYIENQSHIVAMKKMHIKHADAVNCNFFPPVFMQEKALKSFEDWAIRNFKDKGIELKENQIFISPVINTTNVLDSHGDVHLDGLWNKSLKEQKYCYLNNIHKQTFEDIISVDVKPYVIETDFKTLGYNFAGKTQVLIYDVIIDEFSPFDKSQKTKLYDGYKDNLIWNHSVEMRYKDILLGINDSRYPENKEIFDELIQNVHNVNKDEVEEFDMIWFVKQAQHLGGAGVPHGSNQFTPNTISIAADKGTLDIENQPSADTDKENKTLNLNFY